MFNFDQQKFNFNAVLENNMFALSLDDYDDDILDVAPQREDKPQQQRNPYADIINVETNFELFLKVHVFNAIGISLEGNDDGFANSYAWKKVSKDGETHYIAFITYTVSRNSKNYSYDLYVDLNDTTKVLRIGNCTTFKRSKFFKISYPLIKICEKYIDGPVYIGDIYFNKPFAQKVTVSKIVKDIDLPLDNVTITDDISIWRCVWNNVGYYLPDLVKSNNFIEIENKLKLSSEFMSHFAGFTNTMDHARVTLFYKMFESFEDFSKMVTEFCKMGAHVKTEFGMEFTAENYQNNLSKFSEIVSEKLGIEVKRKQELNDKEEAAKKFITGEFPQTTLDHFESINSKAPTLLSIRTLSKERKSKDPYRKLDLPVIKLILKDNGIDIEKIVNEYEQKWLTTFYKFVNIFYEHCKRLNVSAVPNEYNRYVDYEVIVDTLFVYDRLTVKFTDANGGRQDFDELTDEELSLIKEMTFGLKPKLVWEGRELIIDKQRLDDPTDACLALCRMLLSAFGRYSGSVISDGIEENNHVYNEFLMLQRFIYILYNLYANDHNKDKDESEKLPELDNTILFNMKHNYVSFGYYGDYYPFNFGDIGMKLNTYYQLYKFLLYISYIIENGYDIQCPNLGGVADSKERLLRMHGLGEDLNDLVEKEFALNNKPNLKVLNMTSIIKMLSTIFTNIDKKL